MKPQEPEKTIRVRVSHGRKDIYNSKNLLILRAEDKFLRKNSSAALTTKTAALLSLIGFCLLVSLNFSSTVGYFNDSASTSNIFSAGTLDIVSTSPDDLHTVITPTATTTIKHGFLTSQGNLPTQYNAHLNKVGGDDEFCGILFLNAELNSSTVYSGTLLGFSTTTLILPSSTDNWVFNINASTTSLDPFKNKQCDISFIFDGWQENLPPTLGFNDTDNLSFDFQPELPSGLCAALSPGYWANHEGCSKGIGSSVLVSQINTLSAVFAGAFANYTGEQICSNMWEPNCPSGNSVAAKLCRAKRHALADELNVVSSRLDLSALIAGADDGSVAFDNLGLAYDSTISQALGAIEAIIVSVSPTKGELVDAATVAERIYSFYEEENPTAPACVYAQQNILGINLLLGEGLLEGDSSSGTNILGSTLMLNDFSLGGGALGGETFSVPTSTENGDGSAANTTTTTEESLGTEFDSASSTESATNTESSSSTESGASSTTPVLPEGNTASSTNSGTENATSTMPNDGGDSGVVNSSQEVLPPPDTPPPPEMPPADPQTDMPQ